VFAVIDLQRQGWHSNKVPFPAHTVLSAFSPADPGLAGCPLDFPSSLILGLYTS